jgi:hypothetical protein
MEGKRIETEVALQLILTMREAQWLKGLMQNPIGSTLADELAVDTEIRSAFWEELERQGVKSI